jgi:hypothetical protein
MNHDEIAAYLLNELKEYGAYLYHESQYGSVYIKFPHWGLGSIRIGDHDKRKQYRYRWEVRTDYSKGNCKTSYQGNVERHIYDMSSLKALVREFKKAAWERGIHPGDKQTWEEYINNRG